MILYIDCETYNEVPNAIAGGPHRYWETAETMLIQYAADDGPVYVIEGTKDKLELATFEMAIKTADQVVYHNIEFDHTGLGPRFHIPIEKCHCTMMQAYLHGLPGGLDLLCDLYKLPQDTAKIKEGKDLVRLFCQPRPKGSKLRRATKETHPEEWKRFVEYGIQDVIAMRAIHKLLPKWNLTDQERIRWLQDRTMNNRGVMIDADLVECVVAAVEEEKASLGEQVNEATDGQVASATKRDALMSHIFLGYGVQLPNMQSATLEAMIKDEDQPAALRELLTLRLQSTTSSTAKYKRMQQCVSSDGAVRGLMQHRGASRTGRVAHKLIQPGNFPRPQIDKKMIPAAIRAFKAGTASLVLPNVMAAAATCIRGTFVPRKGYKLVVADLANIEGRIAAWKAGEEWKLKAYRDYDAGIGPDTYKLAYASTFHVDIDSVDEFMRSIGKVQELFMQYGGGVGAFSTGAAAYDINLDAMAEVCVNDIPAQTWDEAERLYKWWTEDMKKSNYGLSSTTFIVCDALKRLWRAPHAKIAAQWPMLEEAARHAALTGGSMAGVDKVGNWVRVKLASGRYLSYPAMTIGKQKVIEDGQEKVAEDYSLMFKGVNQKTHQWGKIFTYGGKLFENWCQATAADVMLDALPRIEAAGYRCLMTVHDEVITEAPISDEFSVDRLCKLMSQGEPWTKGLPLAAAGFEADRYRKG